MQPFGTILLLLLSSAALVLLGHVFRLLRWEQFIRIYEYPQRRSLLRAMAGGYAVNFLLPFHVGDFLRAALAGRKMKTGTGFAFATVIMDRFLDVWVVALLFGGFRLAGLGGAAATVGENLGTPSQRLVTGTAQELAAQHFAPLSVLLVENVPAPLRRTPGLPDAAFIRGKTPMTKQEVRAAALAKLAVRPTDTLWDVGAGTGSVSVELALAAPAGRVCAVECDAEACDLIRQNRAKFAVQNLHLTEGLAPAALADWPAPDAVFIGGSKGSLRAVVDAALDANPDARLCISAIALETLQEAVAALTAHGLTAQVTQIAVSRSRAAGSLHLLMANNPVFLIARE